MRTQTRGFDNLAQMRHREISQRHALHRLPAKTQNADAERVLSGFAVATHVATAHQGSQEVAGRALPKEKARNVLGVCGSTNNNAFTIAITVLQGIENAC